MHNHHNQAWLTCKYDFFNDCDDFESLPFLGQSFFFLAYDEFQKMYTLPSCMIFKNK